MRTIRNSFSAAPCGSPASGPTRSSSTAQTLTSTRPSGSATVADDVLGDVGRHLRGLLRPADPDEAGAGEQGQERRSCASSVARGVTKIWAASIGGSGRAGRVSVSAGASLDLGADAVRHSVPPGAHAVLQRQPASCAERRVPNSRAMSSRRACGREVACRRSARSECRPGRCGRRAGSRSLSGLGGSGVSKRSGTTSQFIDHIGDEAVERRPSGSAVASSAGAGRTQRHEDRGHDRHQA